MRAGPRWSRLAAGGAAAGRGGVPRASRKRKERFTAPTIRSLCNAQGSCACRFGYTGLRGVNAALPQPQVRRRQDAPRCEGQLGASCAGWVATASPDAPLARGGCEASVFLGGQAPPRERGLPMRESPLGEKQAGSPRGKGGTKKSNTDNIFEIKNKVYSFLRIIFSLFKPEPLAVEGLVRFIAWPGRGGGRRSAGGPRRRGGGSGSRRAGACRRASR